MQRADVRAYEASATIHAPADRIWSILTDAASYPSWDSGITRVDGRIADGEHITVHAEVSAGRTFPVSVQLDAPRTMTWSGGMPLGLFRACAPFG
jgi:uncharacterized protein YndB with AHSA1/START domain